MTHGFTKTIKEVLQKNFGADADSIFQTSQLIQYLNRKTKSANQGSKSRGSFANLYAIYVLVEDYIAKAFNKQGDYSLYEGAVYKNLFARQRELPFGAKLQNHALNNRLNSEFENWFPTSSLVPISRLADSDRYWFNKELLKIKINETEYDISESVIEIINQYIDTKQESFSLFITSCKELQHLADENISKAEEFIFNQLAPNVDARLFEIVSFSILKYFYIEQKIYWGFEFNPESIKEDNLTLYKTGRTNANDGGIDFVMKPMGRFFQVTETLDFKKYFLDIDKLQKFPITFVIKSEQETKDIYERIEKDALKSYSAKAVVDRYMSCIEEIINIHALKERFNAAIKQGHLKNILEEIINQSKVEFNYEEITELSEELDIDENQPSTS